MRESQGSISIAFLDLLSGALAGVIILFLIVPKGSSFASGELSEQKVSIDSLFIVIDSLYLGKDTITTLDIALLREAMGSLRTRVDSVQDLAVSYREDAIRSKARQVVLEDSLRQLRIQQRLDRSRNARQDRQEASIVSREAARTTPARLPSRNPAAPRPSEANASLTKTDANNPTATSTPTPSASAPASSAGRADPRDPMPEMLDPFMMDVRWEDRQDVDLLLLNRAGVVLCNDSRCNKKFAALERSGKRDSSQYERMRVISRAAETYELRVAIHSRIGGGKGEAATTIAGTYYVKVKPDAPATKRTFSVDVAPRQRGDNGAPGVRIGTLTISETGEATFTSDPS